MNGINIELETDLIYVCTECIERNAGPKRYGKERQNEQSASTSICFTAYHIKNPFHDLTCVWVYDNEGSRFSPFPFVVYLCFRGLSRHHHFGFIPCDVTTADKKKTARWKSFIRIWARRIPSPFILVVPVPQLAHEHTWGGWSRKFLLLSFFQEIACPSGQ